MPDIFSAIVGFLSEYTAILVAVSLLSFIAGLILVPYFIARIPADYFCRPRRVRWSAHMQHPLLRLTVEIAKNLLGGVLVLAGLLMLLTPGQGLLTLLAGLIIMNYPGKFALERWLFARPRIMSAVNWLRCRRGEPPLQAPLSKKTRQPQGKAP